MPPFHISFYPFTGVNTTIRLRDGKAFVRLSDMLEGVKFTAGARYTWDYTSNSNFEAVNVFLPASFGSSSSLSRIAKRSPTTTISPRASML